MSVAPLYFVDVEGVAEHGRVHPVKNPEIGILNRSKSSLSPKDSLRNSSESAPYHRRSTCKRNDDFLSFFYYETAALVFVRCAISRDRDSILRLANHGKLIDPDVTIRFRSPILSLYREYSRNWICETKATAVNGMEMYKG